MARDLNQVDPVAVARDAVVVVDLAVVAVEMTEVHQVVQQNGAYWVLDYSNDVADLLMDLMVHF